jgi:hypothetical protein
VAYAASRRQFGKPIARSAPSSKAWPDDGPSYAVESLLYRTAGLIDAAIDQHASSGSVLAAMEEFAIEASIAKVAGSEMLDHVLDENVQIHGGNGFVRGYAAERHYRDARVNRIFEGTNEINRLLISGMLIKRALKGTLPLIPAARKLQDDLLSPGAFRDAGDGDPWSEQKRTVDALEQSAHPGKVRCSIFLCPLLRRVWHEYGKNPGCG